MIRIRFHGRGGQGAKTAARILGTAAFLQGFTAQDSPLYGAERRGAPVAAFTRIARGSIHERGLIVRPDVVLVADETLLDDPAAHVLDGVTADTAVFVNSADRPDQLARRTPCRGRLTTSDLTGMILGRFGKPAALSAPLGAAAARLVGLRAESLRQAVAQELAGLGMDEALIAWNQELAEACFAALAPASVAAARCTEAARGLLRTPTYDPPERGTPRIPARGNSLLRHTGDWRIFRPVLVPERCNGCTLCFVYCPEAAIALTAEERPLIAYDYCKGCLLCVEAFPTKALIAERETAAAGDPTSGRSLTPDRRRLVPDG